MCEGLLAYTGPFQGPGKGPTDSHMVIHFCKICKTGYLNANQLRLLSLSITFPLELGDKRNGYGSPRDLAKENFLGVMFT